MKTITALLIAAIATPAAADHDLLAILRSQLDLAWYQDEETGDWLLSDSASRGFQPPPCADTLAKLREAGVPATATIVLEDDTRDLPRGRHALPAARRACDGIEHAGRVKEVERWILFAAASDDVNNKKPIENCIAAFEKAKLDPATRVPRRRVRITRDLEMWSGTLGELKAKYCEAGLAAITAELTAREAPYRRVLRNDKLRLALAYDATASYVLPGGDTSMNPAKLAAARVWFDSTSAPSNESQVCANGLRRILVRRYTFDANHKLVKTTQAESCGTAVYK